MICSSDSMKRINKLQVAQNKAALCALQCSYRTNAMDVHESLSSLTVSERFTYALLNLIRNVLVTRSPNIVYKRLLSQFVQHNCQTWYATDRRVRVSEPWLDWINLMHIVQESIKEWFTLVKTASPNNSGTVIDLCLCVNRKRIKYGLG